MPCAPILSRANADQKGNRGIIVEGVMHSSPTSGVILDMFTHFRILPTCSPSYRSCEHLLEPLLIRTSSSGPHGFEVDVALALLAAQAIGKWRTPLVGALLLGGEG